MPVGSEELEALEPSFPSGIVATSVAEGSTVLVGIGEMGLCETSFVMATVMVAVNEGPTVLSGTGDTTICEVLLSVTSVGAAHEGARATPSNATSPSTYLFRRRTIRITLRYCRIQGET
jgi:hypothetical protein